MAKNPLPRRKSLPEEEVLTLAQRLGEQIKPYLTWIISGLIGLVLILAGMAGYAYLKAGKQERAQAALNQLRPQLSRPEEATAALEGLGKLLQEYPGTPAAQEAELFRAHLFYQTGKFPEAAQAYEGLLASPLGSRPSWRQLISESLSYSYETQGDFAKAAAALQPLVEQGAGIVHPDLAIRLGYLYEKAGNRQDAAKVWRRLLETSNNPALAPFLKEKLAAVAKN
jgi:predicted negative regulator of RcsB-dependent stress response